jgi:hypothetical protein
MSIQYGRTMWEPCSKLWMVLPYSMNSLLITKTRKRRKALQCRPSEIPLQYFKELIWDDTMAQNRFYGYADLELCDQVKLAAAHGEFSRELGFDLFHSGATGQP